MKPLEAVATLAAAFQKELTPETVTIYGEALADVNGDLLEAAVRQCIRTCTFFPAVAEIRRAAAALSGKTPPSPAEVLGIIRRADHREWIYNPNGSYLRHSWQWPEGLDEKTLEVCQSIARRIGNPCDESGEDVFGWHTDVRKSYEAELPQLEADAVRDLSAARLLPGRTAPRLTP